MTLSAFLILLAQDRNHARYLKLMPDLPRNENFHYLYSETTEILSILEEHDDHYYHRFFAWFEKPSVSELADHLALYPRDKIIKGKMSEHCPVLHLDERDEAFIRAQFAAHLNPCVWTTGRGVILYFLNRG